MQRINCRVCTEKSIQFKRIFLSENENAGLTEIAAIITKHLDLKLHPNDAYSNVICLICWRKLYDFHEFYNKVSEAQQCYIFKNENPLSPAGLAEIEDAMSEIKTEPLSEAQDADKEVIKCNETAMESLNPLYLLDDVTIVTESNDRFINELGGDDRKNGVDSKGSSSSDTDTDSSFMEDKALIEKKPNRKLKKTSKLNANKVKASGNLNSQRSKDSLKKQKEKSYSSSDEALIRKHISFNCGECGISTNDFIRLKEHFAENHENSLAYIRCCGRKYTSRRRQHLLQHAHHHENPEYFKCEQCQKVFIDDYTLQAHMRSEHPKEGDLKFKCEECDKRFARRQQFEWHQASHIPEDQREFFCTKCEGSKGFATLRLLQMHDVRVHKRARNVCHFCAKVISDKVYFERHVRQHTDPNAPRVKCPRPDCDSWLKDRCCLKEHIKRVHRDEGKVFACDECGKTCANRRAVKSHKSYAHSNATFTCGECNKTFKKAISLKEHMAQHTGETLYKCPFCERTFNSNANMHAHKKKMHPVEWDNWRKTKKGSAQQIITHQQHIP